MKTCVALNPSAGSVNDLAALQNQIRAHIPEARIEITARRGSAERVARQAAETGCDLVVAAGGDGTLNEVVNGISGRLDGVALALLPLGTGNDFARSVGIPTDVEQALSAITAGQMRAVDMVRVATRRQRYFINVSAGGFSGIVDEKLTPQMKESWGPLAYVRSAASALRELQAYHTTVAFDDDECLSLNLYNVVVANGRYVAGGVPIAPQASIDDGLLDVVLLCETSAAQLAILIPQVLSGSHLQNAKSVVYRQAKKVCVNPRAGMSFNLDGEVVGEEPVVFDVVPRALQFVVPG